jgi:putative transposase
MAFARKFTIKESTLIYITTPVIDMTSVFSIDELALEAVLQLGSAARQHNLAIVGYCIMPSYMQALVAAREEFDLSEFMHTYRWLSSRAIMCMELGEFEKKLQRKGKFKLWMRRYDHLIITTKDQFQARLDYIHNDPVKKGLVKAASEWRFSSAGDWLLQRDGYI